MKKNALPLNEILSKAVQNHKQNKFVSAEKLYTEFLKVNPGNFDVNLLLATVSAQLKKLEVAKKLFQKAIKIKPQHKNSHYNLGLIFKEQKEFKKAIECYEEAIRIDPNYFIAHNNLGIVHYDIGNLSIARKCYEEAIKINTNYEEAHYNLGVLFQNLGDFEKAKKSYEKAMQINQNFDQAYGNLGNLFENLFEYEKAIKYYEQAIKINPKSSNYYFNLGNVFEELGEYQKAIVSYKQSIKIQPDHVNAYDNLALVFKNLEEYQQAIDCYENAIKYKSDNLKSVYHLSELKKEVLDLNLKERIIKITNKDNCKKGNHIYGNLLLSKYELKNNNYEKEFNYLLKAHSNFPATNKDLFNKEVDYWINKLPRLIESITFKKSEKNDDKIKPIFIVGVPRCGSTLIEKIVASSTKHIPIGEETNVFRNFVAQTIKQNSFTDLNIKDVQKKIIKKFQQKKLIQEKSDYIFTDKSLDNFFYIELIYKIFPNAKFINCKRNPLSSIMSIFKNIFKDVKWGHDLEHILKYMDIYHGMIKNYKIKFPNLIYDLDYQDFVNNPEPESKKLLKFCNLPWDKKCLEFYKRKDIFSKTASKYQIKNAIYKNSGNKYLPYKKFLHKYSTQYDWLK